MHRQYDLKLIQLIRELHQGFRQCYCYGAARLHQTLLQRGYSCSHRRINRLMRAMGIKASTTGLYAWRPGQHEFYSATGNQLKQEASLLLDASSLPRWKRHEIESSEPD